MPSTARRVLVLTALLTAALCGPAAAAEKLYTIAPPYRLITVQSDKPAAVLASVTLKGLAPGEQILGLDRRPANGALLGVSTADRLYSIDPATGQATAVGTTPTPPFVNQDIGFDVDPVADRVRLVSPYGVNFSIDPTTGATRQDAGLSYAAGDPGAGKVPAIAGSAFTNSAPGATSTVLYGLDSHFRTLVVQDPASGVVRTVGPLAVQGKRVPAVTGPVGFDIARDGTAWASFRPSRDKAAVLFRVDLTTGALKAVDLIGPPIPTFITRGLAAAGTVPDDVTPPKVVFAARTPQSLRKVLRRGLPFKLSCSEACIVRVTLRVSSTTVARGLVTLDRAGSGTLRVALSATAVKRIVRQSYKRVTLRADTIDYAGNSNRQVEAVRLTP